MFGLSGSSLQAWGWRHGFRRNLTASSSTGWEGGQKVRALPCRPMKTWEQRLPACLHSRIILPHGFGVIFLLLCPNQNNKIKVATMRDCNGSLIISVNLDVSPIIAAFISESLTRLSSADELVKPCGPCHASIRCPVCPLLVSLRT